MQQAIKAYKEIIPIYEEAARIRELAEHNEASALAYAREQEIKKWEGIVADIVAEKDAKIAALMEQINMR